MSSSSQAAFSEVSDAMLLRAIAGRDSEAFHCFYVRWSSQLLAVLRHLARSDQVAEDVLQEVFLAVWRRASSYDPTRGDVGGWLYIICRNRWVDFLRRSRAGDLSENDLPEPQAPAVIHRRELSLDLQQAFAELRDEERDALLLAFFGGLTHEETAERLDLPLGTLKSRIRLGLRKLAKKMKSYEQTDRSPTL